MSPRRTDAAAPTKGDRREQALIAVAERLLAERGFESSSVADLAAEAGISRATFYFYFASKRDLLAAAVEAVVADLEGRLVEQMSSVGPASHVSEVVAGTVRAAADLWWEHRVVMRASVELGSAVTEVYVRNRASITGVGQLTCELLRTVGHRAPADDDIDRLVTALVLMTERNFYDLARSEQPRSAYDELADLLVTIWLRALGL